MSGTTDTSAVAARLQQIKQSMGLDTGQTGFGGTAADAPAGPIAATPAAAPLLSKQQQQQRHVTINPDVTTLTDQPNISSTATLQQQQGLDQQVPLTESPKPSAASNLSSVKTSAGPIVMTTAEDTANAQQALRLLNTYDFKIYGQGLSAGSNAEPLQPPGQKVLYKPEPVAPEPPLPPSVTGAAAAAGGDAAAHNRSEQQQQQQQQRVGGIGTTPSGTPTVFMQPLPADTAAAAAAADMTNSSSSSSSRPEEGRSSPAAATAAEPALGKVSTKGLSSSTIEHLQQQQQQPAIDQPQIGMRRRKQQPYSELAAAAAAAAGPHTTSPNKVGRWWGRTKARFSRDGSSSSSSSRPSGSRIGRWWGRTKTNIREGFEDAAAWMLHMLAMLALWVLKILLIPIRAIFGPWYHYNRRLKVEQRDLLAEKALDLSSLHDALGALPSWLSGVGGATEKLTWLNQLLAQIWPVLDPVVCQLIRSSVEPMLDDMKPPFIAAMGFQKLTLGELPLELEGIRVVGGDYQGKAGRSPSPQGGQKEALAAAAADDDDRIELEVDFRWVGEPNISFFVELAMAGPYTRMVPKLSHLTARGTLRLGLTRLVPQLPGFGALLISMARTPQVKFSLDFGPALGGKFTAKPVAAFLDPFIRDTLANLLVWPNRFVIPLLPREVTGNLDDLTLHSVGVLEVEVLAARELPKKGGTFSTVDPQVELWTQPQHHVFTSVKKSSRNPNWRGQKHELLIQEPDSQLLRLILNDIDMLNVKELLRVNLLKGAANLLRSARPIGRAAVPLRDICKAPFKRQELELRLSGSEWAYELGVLDEDDSATLRLAVQYKPFLDLDAASTKPISAKGALFVDLRQCEDLPEGDYHGGGSDPYVLLKIAGQKQQTPVSPNTVSPTYNAHFEFFNVQAQDVLQVQVWDKDTLKPDDLLGTLELPVTAIIDWSQGGKRGWRDGWWKLRGGRKGKKEGNYGRIEMKVQFRPY